MKRIAVSLCLAVVSVSAQAETFEINLSNKALRADFAGPLSTFFHGAGGIYDAGILVGDTDDRDFVQGHLGVLVTGDAGARDANVTAGLGGRLLAIDVESIGGGALALGGQVEARMPAFNRIGMIGYVYGAPKASALGDLDGYLEYAVSADYQVLRQASIYLGYRQLKLDIENAGTATVDTGFHGGLRLNF